MKHNPIKIIYELVEIMLRSIGIKNRNNHWVKFWVPKENGKKIIFPKQEIEEDKERLSIPVIKRMGYKEIE